MVTLVQQIGDGFGNTSAPSQTLPSTPTEGNLLLLILGVGTSPVTPTLPSGFTEVPGATVKSSGASSVVVATKVAGAAEGTTFTVTGLGGGDDGSLYVGEFASVDATPVTDAMSDVSASNGSTVQVGPLTTTVAAGRLFAITSLNNGTGGGSWNDDHTGGFAPILSETGSGHAESIAVLDVTAAGTYSTTHTWTNSRPITEAMFLLSSASGGGVPVDQIAGDLTTTVILSGALSVPTAAVPQLTATLASTVVLSGTLDAPAATVPGVAGDLTTTVGLAGTLNMPAATVPTLTGSLDVTVTLVGTLSVPGGPPEVSSTLAFTVAMSGILDVPVAAVPQLVGDLSTTVVLAGMLATATVSVPATSGMLSVAVGLSGSMETPTAIVADLSGDLASTVTLSGTLADPAFELSTPTERTLVVAAEDRTFVVEAEDRTYLVGAESRTLTASR